MSEILPKIDQFSILAEIYTRNSIKLFKVVDNSGNDLALKMLQQDSPQKIKQFEKEITILKSLSHIPCIPKVSTVQKFHGNLYYTMDYIEGMSLQKHIECNKRLDETEVLRIIKDVASIVNEIHKKDTIHCDLNPNNIMLQDNKVFIIDFGIALTEKDLVTSEAQDFKGTLNYISPEQANGEYSKVGFWSDIYSIGAIMYHMVTGDQPFAGANNIEIIHNLAQNNLRPINNYNLNISAEIQRVIYKALQSKIANRYTNIKDFLADVQKISNEPTNAFPETMYFEPKTFESMPVNEQKISNKSTNVLPETLYFEPKTFESMPVNEQKISNKSTNILPEPIDFEPNVPGNMPANEQKFSNALPSEYIQNEKHFQQSKETNVISENIIEKINYSDNKDVFSKMETPFAEKKISIAKRKNLRRTARNSKQLKNNNSIVLFAGVFIGVAITFITILIISTYSNTNYSNTNKKPDNIEKENDIAKENIEHSTNGTAQNTVEVTKNKEEIVKNNNPWHTPVQIGSLYNAKWTLKDNVWHGTSAKTFGLMVIKDFPQWQNYTFTAEVFVVQGKLGIFMRGFAATAQFPDFLNQMRIMNNKNRWYTVVAIANGNRLSIKVDDENASLSSIDSTLENSGIVGFGLQPENENIPALVYVKNIKLQKLP